MDIHAFRCTCCLLIYKVPGHQPSQEECEYPAMCNDCKCHQGFDSQMRLKRAESHEEKLRWRFAAAIKDAQDARCEAAEMEVRMRSALETRGNVLCMVAPLRGYHLNDFGGRCSCGDPGCEAAIVLNDPWLNQMIDKALGRNAG
jgi:hypothetical protein